MGGSIFKKRSKKEPKASSTPKVIRNSFAPSAKSTPGRMPQQQRHNSDDDSNNNNNSSSSQYGGRALGELDVGNHTEPYSGRPRKYSGVYLTPDAGGKPHGSDRRACSSRASQISGSHSSSAGMGHDGEVDTLGDNLISLQADNSLEDLRYIPVKRSRSRDSSFGMKPSAKSSKLNLDTASDFEGTTGVGGGGTTATSARMTNNDSGSQHWGIISSLMNAAQHIGSLTNNSHEALRSPTHQDTADSKNFGEHLDALLSNSSGKLPHAGGGLDNSSIVSRSNARDVQFQPLRKTLLSTMGKGELTLEDLGVPPSINGKRLSSSSYPPQIEVHDSNTTTRSETADDILPRELVNHVNDSVNNNGAVEHGNGSIEISNRNGMIAVPANINYSNANLTSRSMSPPPIRRSLSPNAIRTIDSLNSKHRRSFSSYNGNGNGYDSLSLATSNGDVPMSSPLPSVELKDISFASPKRNSDFHNTFRKIPKSEKLIEDYSCALQKDILVQGRVFISERHICFKSNILGWVTNIIIPIHEIVQLEKKTTAGLFPNGIVIQTLHQKYVFASFLTRDTTFELITNIWNQLVRGSLGLDDVDVLLDMDGDSGNRSYDYDDEYDSDTEEELDRDNDDNEDSDDDEDFANDDTNRADDDRNGLTKHSPTEIDHEEVSGEVKLIEDTISAPLPKVFNQLFGKDSSFLQSVISKQKNKNISAIPEFSKSDDVLNRDYRYTKPLNAPIGPKETVCNVTETLDHKDFSGYVLCTQTTRTPDVPSGGSFSVVTQIYLSWGLNNSTKITVYTYMNWTGKSWIRAAIDKGSIDGQKESIGILVDELKAKNSSGGQGSGDNVEEQVSDLPLVGPKTHAPSTFSPNIASNETLLAEETFQAPLGTVYSIIFDPSYMKAISLAQKNFDLSDIGKFPDKAPRERSYEYTKPLNGPIGPKQTHCEITETIETFDLNSHIHLVQSVVTPDVPSGSSFSVKTNFYLYWTDNNSTRMVVSTYVNWTGKSWIKGVIEKGSIDGQKDSIAVLINEVKNTLSSAGPGSKRKKRKSIKLKKEELETVDTYKEMCGPSQGYRIPIPGLDSFLEKGGGSLSLLLLVMFLAVLILRKMVTIGTGGGAQPHQFEYRESSKVVIGGEEFLIIPSIDTSLNDPRMRMSKEFDIWDWIGERSDGTNIKRHVPDEDIFKQYKKQDLKEMVYVAEKCLEGLKSHVDE
ncbi:YSP2 [Cyberlindnera jadinii]|uniref:YSP2 protein n=3 Tax=Cyberlindnera jadinii (strain ATCC 18201 / CBS 1600 / BCRC 20928 / JCM 3617 / NBRC 0987 / NRRL Y-1542) TaxID=983966 RepID=A0A0H5CGA1_CYBJN|nr:YSP2 [Cyberlindnera jadinii]